MVVFMQFPPIELGEFDHYTLIVENAREVADFHINVLGFRQANIQLVNAGSAPPGEYDMLNHILWLPGSDEKVMVVTEGLTENSIFYRYYWRYGPGVHHVAYTVDDIDETLEKLRNHGVETTSEEILQDPISGLKQIFLAKEHCGYFVELIERNDKISAGEFVEDNMSALANTMQGYLDESENELTEESNPSILIHESKANVLEVLTDPFRLPEWTCHKIIALKGDRLVESRMHGDLDLKIESESDAVNFTWSIDDETKSFKIPISETEEGVIVSVDLSKVPDSERAKLHKIISIELEMLAALVEGEIERISDSDIQFINEWHLEIHQRKGL